MDKDKIRVKLMELGFSPAVKGFESIVKAVCILDEDPSAAHNVVYGIYYPIAKETNTNIAGAERRIRTAITSAVNYNAEAIQDFIKLPANPSSGSYKNADFLAALHMALHRG